MPICERLVTSSLWHPSRMNHFSLSEWEKLYDHDLMTNLTEKGMEKSCSLDTINPYRPDVIELSGKYESIFL